MSVTLLSQNLLESGTVTVTSALAGNPKGRLYDRDQGPQCIASGAGQWDVDLVLGGDLSASALGIITHNIGASVEVYADTALAIGTTLIATLAPVGVDPFYGAFTLTTKTKWRLRFLAFGSAPAIGEVLLGVPAVIGNPSIDIVTDGDAGNVGRDESPGGYAWAVQRGAKRARLLYGWKTMAAADWTSLVAVFDQAAQGAKPLLVVDVNGTARWMEFSATEVRGHHVAPAYRETTVELLERL